MFIFSTESIFIQFCDKLLVEPPSKVLPAFPKRIHNRSHRKQNSLDLQQTEIPCIRRRTLLKSPHLQAESCLLPWINSSSENLSSFALFHSTEEV
ncbi:hypothetical protein TNCT_310001 [Trichonephila clavata]|uniref:Uncharacterized protein n=1 Tax=Trichonephila clavata TaxID=2740835 RepID=A0A8X6HHT6_TRICU|nr:hypothetical protein TNCT_310001 [Trichonephila clavata]